MFRWSRNFEEQLNRGPQEMGQAQEMGSPQEVFQRKDSPAQDLQEVCPYSFANTVLNHR